MTASLAALSGEAHAQSVALLREVVTPGGFLASPTDVANYRRVWARDGVLCGLAGLLTGDDDLAGALRATLETLAAAQGPDGQIPSNVLLDEDERARHVSYGGVCGRVDPVPWFVVGVSHYAFITGDRAFARKMASAMRRGLDLLTAWEFNRRGLVYIPQGGNWADEYMLHGYVLYDQLLRLQALRSHARATSDAASAVHAETLAGLLRKTFWPMHRTEVSELATYHFQR